MERIARQDRHDAIERAVPPPRGVLAAAFLFNLGQGVLRPSLPLYLQQFFGANYRMVDIEPYLEAAGQKAMRITHIIETHVQADHVSGARRLAEATRAPVLFHEAAPVNFPHVGVADGEEHELGNVRLTMWYTPGHTPDGLSILVTDRSRGPQPWFVLTGDTLFSGGVGRPDLLGEGMENQSRRAAL
jgi:glyoxylase-like metal-dependent hydrolase (beta-lactamase superfamily II)